MRPNSQTPFVRPDADYLRQLFILDKETGHIYWRSGALAGVRAGSKQKKGYVRVGVSGKHYYAHRIVWCLTKGAWPNQVLDHINGIKSDNRIENLRELTPEQNSACRVFPARGKRMQVLGVYAFKHETSRRFYSVFTVGGVTKSLGSFETIEAAKRAYENERKANLQAHGVEHDVDFHLSKIEGIEPPAVNIMSSIQQRAGRWQLRVRHKLLPTAFFHTFDTEAEARAYGEQLEALLARGIVPIELAEAEKRGSNPLLSKIITQYLAESNVAPSDRPTLDLISRAEGNTRLQAVTAAWVDLWVSRLKVGQNLKPGTIKKRVESLARALDWYWRRMGEAGVNPLRSMPRGYASPTAAESSALKTAGLEVRRDTQRNRRLDAAELARIRLALTGQKAPDKQRGLTYDPEFELLFELILATGMRLSEAYGLRVDQVDFGRWVINVEGSKGHRGAVKPRMVPMVKPLRVPLQNWCRDRVGRVFSFWDGTTPDKVRCTMRLSARFVSLFGYAGVTDFTEHDLRHCATCDWVSMRDAAGRWVFSEVEVCKIMGWTDTRMMLRYASLRGEDLASRLG